MKHCYETVRFNHKSWPVVEKVIEIVAEYRGQGYSLTLRQLYYQFVARGHIANTMRDYKRLGGLVSKARRGGYLDWEAIEDRTRNLQGNSHWGSPGEIVQACVRSYAVDKWEDQPHRVEVWVEKEALVGVVARVAGELDVDYFACRGYVSDSEMEAAARRHIAYERCGQSVTVLHLGDHDPSGIDMSRDIQERLDLYLAHTNVLRIALNMDQVEEYTPPPNPAKLTDTRCQDYMARFGDESWELDALEPAVLSQLIKDHVTSLRDDVLYEAALVRQESGRDKLRDVAETIDDE